MVTFVPSKHSYTERSYGKHFEHAGPVGRNKSNKTFVKDIVSSLFISMGLRLRKNAPVTNLISTNLKNQTVANAAVT